MKITYSPTISTVLEFEGTVDDFNRNFSTSFSTNEQCSDYIENMSLQFDFKSDDYEESLCSLGSITIVKYGFVDDDDVLEGWDLTCSILENLKSYIVVFNLNSFENFNIQEGDILETDCGDFLVKKHLTVTQLTKDN